ncbi:heavy metal translocating P-type ATPase [Pedobacter chitinilyticus]|uniref:P-type Zn(2+) transporter n=1 Tax=Pedobacter chitinilyticus TaxID=2233776 RepID=A0A443YWA0_9SPHI|nr:heavy metal translocating P-type ATPase [Pedobacter chitinilyticus]RWU08272.1 cadmium-translocating P-type ATPase [Pedobacter chitinilyticus]
MAPHQNHNEDGCCGHQRHEKHPNHHDHDHDHSHGDSSSFKTYLPVVICLVILLAAIAFDQLLFSFFTGYLRLAWYLLAYFLVAWPVIKEAFATIAKGNIFTEFLLMTLATIGALALGEYPEAVAVMLFYSIGELFQDAAVNRAKKNIKSLLDVRPDTAMVYRNGEYQTVKPQEVEIGETLQLKAGEKSALDGELLSDSASFNTAALTGESKPNTLRKGETVLAGMLNLDGVVSLKVTKRFEDSALSRILDLVQNASAKKAKTELLIRRFAKIYTPIVFFLAIALVFVPYFFVANYQFNDWLYRALVFLVISCPCALVISIPLGYFGGIGAASANGILFKGSNYLDLITKVNTVVLDKTGTLTQGVFKVKEIQAEIPEQEFLAYLASLESQSTHPIAKAVVAHANLKELLRVEEVKEIAGHGLKATVNGATIMAGNGKLLRQSEIAYPEDLDKKVETTVLLAVNGKYAGFVSIADEIKPDAKQAILALHAAGVDQIVMLSGDKTAITQKVADELGVDQAHGDLLPEGKVEKLESIKKDASRVVAFVGDGINDAPVLALSDVGMAMGALGSDVAIETADVVIQNDMPSKIAVAIQIGRATKKIVYQNISLAFGVKAVVLILGAGGLATMWEAVFADVGVAFLAILNAVRIQRMKF